MSRIPYTETEKRVKKYTVGTAAKIAETRLKGRGLCINAISGRSLAEPITLVELNNLVDQMVDDSFYHS